MAGKKETDEAKNLLVLKTTREQVEIIHHLLTIKDQSGRSLVTFPAEQGIVAGNLLNMVKAKLEVKTED